MVKTREMEYIHNWSSLSDSVELLSEWVSECAKRNESVLCLSANHSSKGTRIYVLLFMGHRNSITGCANGVYGLK